MIGLRQLASLLAGAIVLFGSVLVPAGDEGAVAIEQMGNDKTRAFAEQPTELAVEDVVVHDLITSRSTPAAPASVEGGFQRISFLAGPGASATIGFGDKDMPVPAGSSVTVEGFSGTFDTSTAEPGLSLSLTGTAKSLSIQPPQSPPVETYTGAETTVPARNVTLGGEPVSSSFERGGAFDRVAFTVTPEPAEGDEQPAITAGGDVFPFEQTVRVRVSDYAGVVAVAETDRDHVRLTLDGFGNVTVFGEGLERRAHQEVHVEPQNPNEDPTANFTYRPSIPQAAETVHFQSNASDELAVRSWQWTFGDGAHSQAQHPEHTYASSGTYEVTLTVTDVLGRTDTETRTIEIVNSRPIVGLEWDPATVIEGSPATFTANATDRDGEIVSYNWSIPNRTDGLRGPTIEHTFAEQGIHELGVIVTDEEGAKAEATSQVRVENAPPTANFTLDPSDPMARETVFLESTSSDYGDGQVVDHHWEISSVGTEDGEVVKTTFPSDGQHEVTLRVRDDDGDTSSETRVVSVRNAPPDASIRITPKPLNPDTPIEFSADVTDDDPIQTAEWNFSDGVERDGLRTVRTFAEGGAYNATLRVQDADGAWTTVEKAFYVNKAPDVRLGPLDQDPTEQIAVETSDLFTLSARVDDPDSNETDLAWSVDGNHPSESNHCTHAPDGNRSRMQCGWPDDGRHLVRVHARDEEGAVDTARTEVLVLNRAPSVNPDIITDVVNAGQVVTMTANADDPDGTVAEVVWRVDGHQVGVGETIDHRFDEPGNHTVEVAATDDDASVESTSFDVEVNERPDASLSVSPQEPVAGEQVTFTADAVDPDGDDAALSYEWTFDDGANASGEQVTHTYDVGGTFSVELAVTDDDGATITRRTQIEVDTPPLGAQLSVEPSPPIAGDPVTFNVSVEQGREIEEIHWRFGDGHTETTGAGVQETSHTYEEPRRYDLTVDIYADHGEHRQLNADLRITGASEFEVVFEPRLPNGQCLDLASDEVDVEATNLATGTTIGLQGGDVSWTTGDCLVRYTFPAGAWAIDDQLAIRLSAGHAETTTTYRLPNESPLVDRDLRLRYAPVSFGNVDVISPGQPSQSEENATYEDPTQDVFVTGQAVWVDGTVARGLAVEMSATYRGVDDLQGPPIEYYNGYTWIPDNGTFVERVPAPVLGTNQEGAQADSGPSLTYLPGQYRVELRVTSGLASDVAVRSFVEDPAGIFDELEALEE